MSDTSLAESDKKRFVVRGKAFSVSKPLVMGIVNVTPDSFSDGGKFTDRAKALSHIEKLISDGANIIDVGGESTRPGSDPVEAGVEIDRTIPLLEIAVKRWPNTFFSIDTTKSIVAQKALEAGAHFVNDVSGLQKSPEFADLCASYQAGLILMHSKGEPKVMQQNPNYEDVTAEVLHFLVHAAEKAKKSGVETVIIDPGIGFGKNFEHNITLIQNIDKLKKTGFPILVGASRKSFIGEITGNPRPENRLAGTIAVHYHCLLKGADIIRVHDVKEAIDSILVYNVLHEKA